MTWKESLEWQTKEKAFLDTKDLKPFLTKDKSIYGYVILILIIMTIKK